MTDFVSFFTILNTNVPLIVHAKKYPVVQDKKLILLFLLFIVAATILDIHADPILLF